ncbi:TetR/AcrR family transcriptional regulator [Phyllobacterium sp. YR531]|uniref:TetR/AcrR family transcriptional regulator n=1 Tax=Phyllobacterium sp. YR531 TaxID=1144343 RepID=UPI00026FBA59|nr:TetR/AcrR family transcriptional regulator [Phyllobacterium sp. YR531]EJN06754.1 transcriptional regulator [Phyllobacterium sp. YR531]
MKRTKEQAAETRRQILRAAENLFLDKGYENVTLDEIATAAGASRGALHWHFGNKQGLLYALRDEAQSPLQELADCLDAGTALSPLDMLGDAICSIFAAMHHDKRRRGLIRVMMYLDISISQKKPSKSQRNEVYDDIARIFAEANRRQRLPSPWTPVAAASAVSAVVVGILEEWSLERSDLQLVPHGQDLVKMVVRGFQLGKAAADAGS